MRARLQCTHRVERCDQLERGAIGIGAIDFVALHLKIFQHAHVLHRGRRARETELRQVGIELGRTDRFDRPRLRPLGVIGLDPDRLRDTLGAGQHSGQIAFDFLETFVAFALGPNRARAGFEFELAHAGYLRETEQLGDFRPDLSGLGVERILTEQDQIERLALEPHREGTRGSERVGAGKSAVHQMHRAVEAHRERVGQRGFGLRRPHRDRHGLGAEALLQIDRERDRAQVERADHRRTVAPKSPGDGIEIGVLDQRDLLDADRDFEHASRLIEPVASMQRREEPNPLSPSRNGKGEPDAAAGSPSRVGKGLGVRFRVAMFSRFSGNFAMWHCESDRRYCSRSRRRLSRPRARSPPRESCRSRPRSPRRCSRSVPGRRWLAYRNTATIPTLPVACRRWDRF